MRLTFEGFNKLITKYVPADKFKEGKVILIKKKDRKAFEFELESIEAHHRNFIYVHEEYMIEGRCFHLYTMSYGSRSTVWQYSMLLKDA